ncbi:hypothetical protein D3C81_1748720 [compost metagenome]
MRDHYTGNMLHLISELQERHGPYPLGRPGLVTWLSGELTKTPGDAGVLRILADYPVHLAWLQTG